MTDKKSIAVCIGAHSKTFSLIRSAATQAKNMGIPWIAIYVETSEHYTLDNQSRERIITHMALAESLGAEIKQVQSDDVVSGIIDVVKQSYETDCPISLLVIGRVANESLLSYFRKTVSEKVTKKLGATLTEVHIKPLSSDEDNFVWSKRFQLRQIEYHELLLTLVIVFSAYIISLLLKISIQNYQWQINQHNVVAIFLMATVVVSLKYGLILGLVSAILGFSTINYFYVLPVKSFAIDHSADSIGLSIFLISALLISLMGAYSRSFASALSEKEKKSEVLYSLHKVLAHNKTKYEAIEALKSEIEHKLGIHLRFFLPKAINPNELDADNLPKHEYELLDHCWKTLSPTGLGVALYSNTNWRFEPLCTADSELGVMGVHIPDNVKIEPSFGQLITAIADQIAHILENIELNKLMGDSKINEEREKLRSLLLSSVSHDLKTPLASIIGSLGVYNRMKRSQSFNQETADELVNTALEEAQRLNGFITNILDMTKIESGSLKLNLDWECPEKPILTVKRSLKTRLQDRILVINKPKKMPKVYMDTILTEQVLQNIFENAIKFSSSGSQITVSLGYDFKGNFIYTIHNEGSSIPEDKLEAIFDKYERLRQSDNKVAGTGLGLAISKAIMKMQDGSVYANNSPNGGVEFVLSFSTYQ